MSVHGARARNRGVAIVLALGVVALAVLAVTGLLLAQGAWTRQVQLATGHAQAQRLVEAGVDWSRAVLHDDRRLGQIDHAAEAWAMRMPSVPVGDASVVGRIEDQQARFNLNNLVRDGQVDPRQLERLQRLLALLDLDAALAGALADWIDPDAVAQGGAEDAYYLALPSPYLAANAPLADLDELALVRGFDARVRQRLQPFVSALPGTTAVNVNTASPEVLAALVPGLSLDAARALVADRQRAWFLDRTGFFARLPTGLRVPAEDISVSSDYFLASMQADLDGAQARGSALLARDRPGWPGVVWRKSQ